MQTILYGVLSCKCPVDEFVERSLFAYYLDNIQEEVLDFSDLLALADKNSVPTPLHHFYMFCLQASDDPNSFNITHNDAIRYFCTNTHYQNSIMGLNPMLVERNADYLVNHMILPIQFKTSQSASYNGLKHTIEFKNVFIPPGMDIDRDRNYGMHLGTILTELSEDQAKMANGHLSALDGFLSLLGHCSDIDFKSFHPHGNHFENVNCRFVRNMD